MKHTLTSSKFGKHITHGVSKSKNKRCDVLNIITKGKSYTFKNSKTTFINRNLKVWFGLSGFMAYQPL